MVLNWLIIASVISADIKSYYASIPHYRLIQDIKKLYDDTRAQGLLERVIRNPLETKCGYKKPDHDFLKINGFGAQPQNHAIEIMRNVPHARTLRNAREQVRVMIYYGISTQHIRHYLSSWARWWTLTIESWSYPEILARLIDSCWDTNLHVAAMAEGLRQRYLKKIEVPHELEAIPL